MVLLKFNKNNKVSLSWSLEDTREDSHCGEHSGRSVARAVAPLDQTNKKRPCRISSVRSLPVATTDCRTVLPRT